MRERQNSRIRVEITAVTIAGERRRLACTYSDYPSPLLSISILSNPCLLPFVFLFDPSLPSTPSQVCSSHPQASSLSLIFTIVHPIVFSAMFGLIEGSKTQLRIQEYSIAQTSLEQIFNQFAAQQEEEK